MITVPSDICLPCARYPLTPTPDFQAPAEHIPAVLGGDAAVVASADLAGSAPGLWA